MTNADHKYKTGVRYSLALMMSAAMVLPVHAQESVFNDTIVVTAQKREQDAQDVGIAITAFSGDAVEKLGFVDSVDIVAQVPGVEVSATGAGTNNSFSIRGVSQNDFAAAQESPVAVYVDDAYISHNLVTGFSLYDIERVEVLRGPQGTLFGRNATGGLIHYVTKRPTFDPTGKVSLQVGQDGRARVEAAAGGPVTDNVAVRFSGVFNKQDGLIENDIGPDVMDVNNYSLRGQALFQPSDSFSALARIQYSDEDSAAAGYGHTIPGGDFLCFPGPGEYTVTDTDCFGYVDADGDPYTASLDFDGFVHSEYLDASLHLNWDLGGIEIVSITNFQDLQHAYGEDSDVSPNSVFHYVSDNDAEQVSQEIRLSGGTESLRWITGVYFLNIDGAYNTSQTGEAFFGTDAFDIFFNQTTRTLAGFGQLEYDLSDRLTLIAGGRVNNDKKEFDITFDFGGFVFGERAQEFSDTDYALRAQLNYSAADNTLLYASINRGIKSGGFNLPLDDVIPDEDYQYGGETLWAYEIGVKTQLTDSLRLNLSAFYYDYNDQQVFSFDGFVPFLFNAEEGKNIGFEAEIVANPVEGLDLLFGIAYQDPEIRNAGLTARPVLTADLSLNGLARYEWEAFSSGNIYVQGDFNWKGDHNFNLNPTPSVQEDAYGLINAKIGFVSRDQRWEASIFGRNLTDTQYRRYAFDTLAFFGSDENVLGIPRWFGGNVTYRW